MWRHYSYSTIILMDKVLNVSDTNTKELGLLSTLGERQWGRKLVNVTNETWNETVSLP